MLSPAKKARLAGRPQGLKSFARLPSPDEVACTAALFVTVTPLTVKFARLSVVAAFVIADVHWAVDLPFIVFAMLVGVTDEPEGIVIS